MGLRLSRKRAPAQIIDLGEGASLTIRPTDSIDREAADLAMRDVLRRVRAAESLAGDYGDLFGATPQTDPQRLGAVTEFVLIVEMTLVCATGWTGVLGADDERAPLDRPHVAALLADPAVLTAVRNALLAPLWARDAEKNVSAGSSNGAPAADLPIAAPAGSAVNPAPVDNAA